MSTRFSKIIFFSQTKSTNRFTNWNNKKKQNIKKKNNLRCKRLSVIKYCASPKHKKVKLDIVFNYNKRVIELLQELSAFKSWTQVWWWYRKINWLSNCHTFVKTSKIKQKHACLSSVMAFLWMYWSKTIYILKLVCLVKETKRVLKRDLIRFFVGVVSKL